jgi:cytochrome bd-type quinol oxidase subunit 2
MTQPLQSRLNLVGRTAAVLIAISFASYFIGIISVLEGRCFSSPGMPVLAPISLLPAAVASGLLAALALIRRTVRGWLLLGGLLIICGLAILGMSVIHCGYQA